MEGLKDKDLELLAVIERVYTTTFFTPSLNEAAELLGMSKGSVISDMFKRLEAAGAIYFSENRKSYLPKNWRELLMIALATPEPVDVSELEAQLAREKAKNEKLRAELAKLKAGAVSDGMKHIREQNRLRAKKYRDNKKTK